MQQKLIVRRLWLVTKETDFIVNYPTEEILNDCAAALVNNDPDEINFMPEGTGYRIVGHRTFETEEEVLQGTLGGRPTIEVFNDQYELLADNGQKPEE